MTQFRFLVIGSNSFSGAHFVSALLEQGFSVWGVSRSNQPDSVFLPYLWGKDTSELSKAFHKNYHFERIDLNCDLKKLLAIVDKNKITHIVNFASQGMVAESWSNPID